MKFAVAVAAALAPLMAMAQPYPVLRYPVESYTTISTCDRCSPETYLASGRNAHAFLLVFVGDVTAIPNPHIYPWTTRSVSSYADAPAPWDVGGESPMRGVGEPAQLPWIVNGQLAPGWAVVPVPWELIRNTAGEWVRDEHMRVSIYLTPRGCGIPVDRDLECHGRTLLGRTDIALIPTLPAAAVVYKRREVVH